MVHARSFSFTDDSTSVVFPTDHSTPMPANIGSPGAKAGPQSLETALLFFQLRCSQSSWYQELFQSCRAPLQNPDRYLWHVCQEMREWSDSFPDTLPLAFKDFFDLELLYSYVYCLTPNCRVETVSDYGKSLIFEYSMAFMQKIFPISRDPVNIAFYTYHDALRVYFVGTQFLVVLSENQITQDRLLAGNVPYIPPVPGTPPPPPIPLNTGLDNVERSINCIMHITETLKTFGNRWDDSQALHSSFKLRASSLLDNLHRRKQYSNNISRANHSPPLFMGQPSFNGLGNLVVDDWNMAAVFANGNINIGNGPSSMGGPRNGL